MTTRLPTPDEISRAHRDRMVGHLRRAINRAGGSISFAEYMQEALYAPGLGYYSAGTRKFGAEGDFTTAPELSPLFARVLARQCEAILAGYHDPAVLELGAGSGELAAGLLDAFDESGFALARYAILEVSAELRARQDEKLSPSHPDARRRVEWLAGLPEDFRGVIVANEVADALPVERFVKSGGEVLQYRVTAAKEGFEWLTAPAPPFLAAAVRRVEETLGAPLPEGYVSEVSAGLPAWIESLAGCLDRGVILLFDYGLSRREYYAPDRSGGWLRCHYRQHAHDDPLILPGIQDLSAWVDFTAVAEAASDAGLEVAAYLTQADFLLHGGLIEELESAAASGTAAQIELARQAKILTLPGEMGERFKCIALSRDAAAISAPFASADRAHNL